MKPAPQGGCLALDLARRVGVAYGRLEWPLPLFDYWLLPKLGAVGARFHSLDNQLCDTFDLLRPTKLVMESPISPKRWLTNELAMFQQLGLRGVALGRACDWGIPAVEVSASLVRQDILGVHRLPGQPGAIKRLVMHWCRVRGLAVENDDEADACLMWMWAKQCAGGILPKEGLPDSAPRADTRCILQGVPGGP